MIAILNIVKSKFTQKHLFMISVLLVNGGNYLYNLILGRILGPSKFADAAILITFLLVLSFVAMTFQLVTSKFVVLFESQKLQKFISIVYKNALVCGIAFGVLIVLLSNVLQEFFNTSSSLMFVAFGLGVPFYFLMSVNRGVYQGENSLVKLSITYQLEMVSRLVFTLLLLHFFNFSSSILIAVGILASFIFGLIPFKFGNTRLIKNVVLTGVETKMIKSFFIITAFYELTQIIINNSDILLVKHYFDAYNAGLYASLALIGRVVYFIAWMFVMLLLPEVVKLHKEGKNTLPVLTKYVIYIALIASTIVTVCYFFPTQIIYVLFGNEYLAIASLLWKYALATGVFAVSNIFAYYFLSLDKYIPVVISGLFGMLQLVLIILYHNSLEQVVTVQIVAMFILLIVQLIFFYTTKDGQN